MTKPFLLLSALLTALLLPLCAQAEIYKSTDANGNVTYSNVKLKGSKKLNLEPSDTSFGTGSGNGSGNNSGSASESKRGSPAKTATPANFPKVDTGTQNQRDGKRKEILQVELDGEKKALDDAKKAYAEGESNPEVFKTKDGKTLRNVPKFEEKMKTLQADVDAHQRNIDLLNKEISATK
ncbi:MAG: DUF4124 domain-containing protein [Bdellovibrio sp.]|nr:DUF4124 domain-containing protein [Methylotenera sp.]